MNISGPLQSKREALQASLTLQETRSIHELMSIHKFEFISQVHTCTLMNDIEYLWSLNFLVLLEGDSNIESKGI